MDLIRVAPKKPINLMRLHCRGCYLIRIIIAFDWNSSGDELVPRSPSARAAAFFPSLQLYPTSWERFVSSKFINLIVGRCETRGNSSMRLSKAKPKKVGKGSV